MPVAITLTVDEEGAGAVREMWTRLTEAGLESTARNFAYRPHVTLAVLNEDETDGRVEEFARAAARELGGQTPPLRLTLASLAVFPGHPAVLFAAPKPTRALLDLQAALCERAEAKGLGAHQTPHTRAEAFVPHVTLCEAVEDVGAALGALAGTEWPLRLSLSSLDVVRFHPATVLESVPLTG
ncbi:2'-5' RNA ligase family protein [Stappia indica]|uniref:2'-5' RNA ligase superfamily protein n=1 Tax=Stappia indica TaxID=538381 RepID=A0A285TSK3_9HYPH|nr:2'-5' RNA ligase family protein [Stappia indica]SOC24039.1 2'-5' RNA ligase superfamily protein [Stappia indica]